MSKKSTKKKSTNNQSTRTNKKTSKRKKSTTKKAKKKPGKKRSAKNKKKNTRKKSSKKKVSNKIYEVKLLLLISFTLLFMFSLYTNSAGIVGDVFRGLSYGLFSKASYILPIIVFIIGIFRLNKDFKELQKINIIAFICLFMGVLIFFSVLDYSDMIKYYSDNNISVPSFTFIKQSFNAGIIRDGGGALGNLLAYILVSLFSNIGAYLIAFTLVATFVILTTKITITNIIIKFQESANYVSNKTIEVSKEARKKIQINREAKRKKSLSSEDKLVEFKKSVHKHKSISNFDSKNFLDDLVDSSNNKISDMPTTEEIKVHDSTITEVTDEQESSMNTFDSSNTDKPFEKEKSIDPTLPVDKPSTDRETTKEADKESVNELSPNQEQAQPCENVLERTKKLTVTSEEKNAVEGEITESIKNKYKNYKLPSISLLNKVKNKSSNNRDELIQKATILEDTLNDFNVDAKVVEINKGPSVTRFEIQPSPGVKVKKIVSLSDDIALSLAAQHVRMIAPIPGKSAIGIEVPNKEKKLVSFREVINSPKFKDSDSKLQFALGHDISGDTIIADLSKMPHMLIAGATGSGKSVCINTLINSILYKAKPDEVKLLLIDPKVVELSGYNGLPHLILPVVTDPQKAAIALNWVVEEMEKRYDLFAKTGSKDLDSFNSKDNEDLPEDQRTLPKIVVIIDELADLMMVSPKQIEDSICRIAQMARAAGIHMILATQRPSVDVITGVIKANIPSRIAFSVSSSADSRTILDAGGADKLLGKGDMLYSPIDMPKPRRIQGAYISDEEVANVIEFITEQVDHVTYNKKVVEKSPEEILIDNTDEFFDEAVKLVIKNKKASISKIQRKFRIGYNRAARIVDDMEARGIVGPHNGSKPREVLLSLAEYESVKNNEVNDSSN